LGHQHTELKDVIGRALDTVGSEMQANEIICKCDFSGETVVFVEPTQIEQAIVNLASVAVNAMKNTDGPRELRVSTALQGSHAVLSLSDSSAGIQADVRDAIFDPTYTEKEGGRGIRLAIARTIAQLHGGSLDIASSDAVGTTMFLRLPVAR
jgi:C4-dicarboxylate-specific signal transduction histidine kinase